MNTVRPPLLGLDVHKCLKRQTIPLTLNTGNIPKAEPCTTIDLYRICLKAQLKHSMALHPGFHEKINDTISLKAIRNKEICQQGHSDHKIIELYLLSPPIKKLTEFQVIFLIPLCRFSIHRPITQLVFLEKNYNIFQAAISTKQHNFPR